MDDNITRVTTLFVYGTLLRGAPNHGRYCIDALTIEPASTAGRLYDLLGGFPCMVNSVLGTTYGEAMTFPDIDETLARLDVLEGYRPDSPGRSLFLRRVQTVTLLESGETVPAYCYRWRGLLPEGAVHIPSGRWSRRQRR